jgi:hypothetical protein
MHKIERKQQDTRDPSIDRRIGLQVRVIDHTFNILCVYFNREIDDSEGVDPDCA